jgi:hypothetical protein
MNNISFADLIAMREELFNRIKVINESYSKYNQNLRDYPDESWYAEELERVTEQRKTLIPEYQIKLKRIYDEIDSRLNQINTTI